ncbi:MAG: hypothetical protein HFH41_10305 [Lachnospiraceae bacterium]|nr:hypothetical protein [Lachnospiraceae bacterium]
MKAAGIRAVKTMAQSAAAMLPATAMITEVDWKVVLGTAALAGIASLLTSLKGLPELEESTEVKEEAESENSGKER